MRTHLAAEVAPVAVTDAAVAKLNEAVAGGGYWNPDLAPVPPSARRWGLGDVVALWVALAACIPTYVLASSLIEEGMNWWQAVLTIFPGNLIVLVPRVLNAHAGLTLRRPGGDSSPHSYRASHSEGRADSRLR